MYKLNATCLKPSDLEYKSIWSPEKGDSYVFFWFTGGEAIKLIHSLPRRGDSNLVENVNTRLC